MTRSIVTCVLLLVLGHMGGCQVVIPGPLPADAGPDVQRDAGYSLLLTVLDQESQVDGILKIKDVTPDTAKLIKALAADATKRSKAIKALAKERPAISWKSEGLPVPEIEARSWIADRTTVDLLTESGASFEVTLILSQLKAAEYIAALANALAKNEPAELRRKQLDLTKREFLNFLTSFRTRLEAVMSTKSDDGKAAPAQPKEGPAGASK